MCSPSLIIRETQKKINLRFHLIPNQNSKDIKTRDNKCCELWGGGLTHCWWGGELVQPLWVSVWETLKKTKTKSVIPLQSL